MNSSDLTEASFGKPNEEKNTVADKPISKEVERPGTCAVWPVAGNWAPQGKDQAPETDGRRAAKRPEIPAAPPHALPVQDLQGSLTSRRQVLALQWKVSTPITLIIYSTDTH